MESKIQSSFIPDDARTIVRTPESSGGIIDLLALIALVCFVASIALAVGVFLYGQYLSTSGASKSAQLERARKAFEPSLIQTLTRLDDRMHAAEDILGVHTAPSLFFNVLEQVTLTTIGFRTLKFEATDSQQAAISMRGVAESVNSIALQADLFTKNGLITSPIFSNIDREADGVHFDVSALLHPSAIRYMNLLASSAGAVGTLPVVEKTQEATDPFGSFEE
ncbi:MAG TPA: hypothetical protein VJH33_00665 [Candidatus Paceibacterota bacterium]